MYEGGWELKGPTIPVSDRKASQIARICHHVQVASDNVNRHRPPPTYFLVNYKDDRANPYALKAPLSEWLTMSELIIICGVNYVKNRIMPASEDKYQRNARFFAAMKQKRLHPDTKAPLNSKDKSDSPWLFPEKQSTWTARHQSHGKRGKAVGGALGMAANHFPDIDMARYEDEEAEG